jgi:hypothetical protein
MRLFDEQGREFPLLKTALRADPEEGLQSRSVTATYSSAARGPASDPNSAPQGEPARLTWDIPLDVRPVEIPFEFVDLPLTP